MPLREEANIVLVRIFSSSSMSFEQLYRAE